MAPAPAPVSLRVATVADTEATRAIYNLEVETSTATFDLRPRRRDEQRAWLEVRSGALSAIVAEQAGQVVGFGALSLYKERPAYRTTVEDSVYVRSDRQGLGVGRLLLTHLLDVAAANGFHAVMARIEASGVASRALHERCGFDLVGIEREVGRKFGRWLDVAVMQCLLGPRLSAGPPP